MIIALFSSDSVVEFVKYSTSLQSVKTAS